MDMLFGVYAVFFYAYGVYLHSGYELTWLDAHHPWINSSFQHYCHHAKSIKFKPYHTGMLLEHLTRHQKGFFVKTWDKLFNSVYDGDCFCAKCCVAKGQRTEKEFAAIVKPDYSVLLQPSFWWKTFDSQTAYFLKLSSFNETK